MVVLFPWLLIMTSNLCGFWQDEQMDAESNCSPPLVLTPVFLETVKRTMRQF
ncbi:hypothetical protein ARMA_2898 [Ardenticatena maritima]|uniref:Uncharacterized protein n=1 Tax=Ardenticatena maritima TaxID=872965 RepID=A0A0M8K9G3_9CHLR|nr:hypothetical protein ARMA_2898 [Ardenticatena maritima]